MMRALLFAGARWTDRHQRAYFAIVLAVILLAASLTASAATSHEMAFFPGTAKISPVTLMKEKCQGGTDAFRAVVHIMNRVTGKDQLIEACWYASDMGGTLTDKDVISTCLRADGTLRTQVTFDCIYIDKRYFIDPKTLPKRALQ